MWLEDWETGRILLVVTVGREYIETEELHVDSLLKLFEFC